MTDKYILVLRKEMISQSINEDMIDEMLSYVFIGYNHDRKIVSKKTRKISFFENHIAISFMAPSEFIQPDGGWFQRYIDLTTVDAQFDDMSGLVKIPSNELLQILSDCRFELIIDSIFGLITLSINSSGEVFVEEFTPSDINIEFWSLKKLIKHKVD